MTFQIKDILTGKSITVYREYLDLTGQHLFTFRIAEGSKVKELLKTKAYLEKKIINGSNAEFTDNSGESWFMSNEDKQLDFFNVDNEEVFRVSKDDMLRVYQH